MKENIFEILSQTDPQKDRIMLPCGGHIHIERKEMLKNCKVNINFQGGGSPAASFSIPFLREFNEKWSFLYNKKMWMLKIENTSEYNKTTDWQVSKNLIEQRGIYNEV